MLADRGVMVAEGDSDRYRLVGDVRDVAVPPSIHALIAARLDTLGADERHVLLDAAVLGQRFSAAGAAALAGVAERDVRVLLDGLVAKQFLTVATDPRSPERGQYAFSHRQTQRVALGTMSKASAQGATPRGRRVARPGRSRSRCRGAPRRSPSCGRGRRSERARCRDDPPAGACDDPGGGPARGERGRPARGRRAVRPGRGDRARRGAAERITSSRRRAARSTTVTRRWPPSTTRARAHCTRRQAECVRRSRCGRVSCTRTAGRGPRRS